MAKYKTKNPYIKLPETPSKGPSLLWIIISFFISRFFGFLMLYFRLKSNLKIKKHSDYIAYANVIGKRITVSISELASKCGKTSSAVISDLQSMINKGIIGEGAYIDRSHNLLVLDPSVVESFFADEHTADEQTDTQSHKTANAQSSNQETVKSPNKEETIPENKSAYNFSGNAEYEEKLRQIRQLDFDIADEAVSSRIDRIGHLTASIFRVVQEHPDRQDEVRRFMSYYLPTTFKLLKSYSLMEKQTYQGDNIAASRKKIEDILDTLVHAFEQQLDRLFQAEAMDVETDINVLETMMTSDGLIEPELSLRSMAQKSKL